MTYPSIRPASVPPNGTDIRPSVPPPIGGRMRTAHPLAPHTKQYPSHFYNGSGTTR